jgi:hypothetical protein
VLVAGYAAFLMVAALCLDLLARHAHRRSDRYRTAGFEYQRELDAWICPEGQHLHRRELDLERRVARYRAHAHVCNSCPSKADCTESDEGREIARALDPWPQSEAGRFHRGISVVLLVLALVILAVGLTRYHAPIDAVMLGALMALDAAALGRAAGAFSRTPSGFPGTPA